MNFSAIPYMLVSRELALTLGAERVYICLCLVDHLILGVGRDREAAMAAMVREFEAKYGDGLKDVNERGLEIDDITFN
ncbi:MAG: hypothetical protein IT462_05925 [Planctomycetes bacterium]|nr:hypothetical protein [Planctomycetota bacterium]